MTHVNTFQLERNKPFSLIGGWMDDDDDEDATATLDPHHNCSPSSARQLGHGGIFPSLLALGDAQVFTWPKMHLDLDTTKNKAA